MKLTLISITFHGRMISRFVQCPHFNGKAVAPASVIADMLDDLGVKDGNTFTIA